MLNKEQKKASIFSGGIHIVTAAAGSGKTKTLIKRIENTIKYGGAKGEEILILTFSRKASEEIRSRAAQSIPEASKITAGTFHSLCYKILKTNPEHLHKTAGFTDFTIMTEDEESALLSKIISTKIDRFLGLSVKTVLYLSGNIHRISPEIKADLDNTGIMRELDAVNLEYAEEKRKNSLLSYNDLIRYTNLILSSDLQLKKKVSDKFRYIFADEFQDTSDEDFALIRNLLPERNPNLFAVGDDWQSIYGFRNANIDYMINPGKYFPKFKRHTLSTNYRSFREIVKISQRAIKKNKTRSTKKIKSAAGKGGTINFIAYNSFSEETDEIIKLIRTTESDSVCVLFRTNYYGEKLMRSTGCAHKASFMTMHASKGLEFDNVIISGIDDSVFPCAFNCIEEERRLFYVALSRAKKNLYILYRGGGSVKPLFIREIF